MEMKIYKTSLMVAVSFGLIFVMSALAQTNDEQEDQPPTADEMTKQCELVCEMIERMQGQMQEMDEELDRKVRGIEELEGEARVEALAEAVAMMASQRRQMNEYRQAMMDSMTQHLCRHMSMCVQEGQGRRMMMRCPMMHRRPRPRMGRRIPTAPAQTQDQQSTR